MLRIEPVKKFGLNKCSHLAYTERHMGSWLACVEFGHLAQIQATSLIPETGDENISPEFLDKLRRRAASLAQYLFYKGQGHYDENKLEEFDDLVRRRLSRLTFTRES